MFRNLFYVSCGRGRGIVISVVGSSRIQLTLNGIDVMRRTGGIVRRRRLLLQLWLLLLLLSSWLLEGKVGELLWIRVVGKPDVSSG